jgi:hypothetical protein
MKHIAIVVLLATFACSEKPQPPEEAPAAPDPVEPANPVEPVDEVAEEPVPAPAPEVQPRRPERAEPAATPSLPVEPPPATNPEPPAPVVPPEPPPPEIIEVELPAGTVLELELLTALDSGVNQPGDEIQARTLSPLYVEGKLVLDSGALVECRVTEAKSSGRVKGRAVLGFTFERLDTGGRKKIRTSYVAQEAESRRRTPRSSAAPPVSAPSWAESSGARREPPSARASAAPGGRGSCSGRKARKFGFPWARKSTSVSTTR